MVSRFLRILCVLCALCGSSVFGFLRILCVLCALCGSPSPDSCFFVSFVVHLELFGAGGRTKNVRTAAARHMAPATTNAAW